MSDLLNRLSSIRAEDPSWPDSSVGEAVEKLYTIVEAEIEKHKYQARQLPTHWKGQKIHRASELSRSDFPYPSEPE